MNESRRIDRSVSMAAANVWSVLITVPLVAGLWALFTLVWSGRTRPAVPGPQLGQVEEVLLLILIFLVGIVVHELLHALGWMVFGRIPSESIRFGVNWKVLTPYAHCTEPVEVNAYRIATFLPGLLLGLLPALAAILWGSGRLLAFGLLFTFAAGGDLLVLWLLRNVPGGRFVEDHPTRAGCYVLEG